MLSKTEIFLTKHNKEPLMQLIRAEIKIICPSDCPGS